MRKPIRVMVALAISLGLMSAFAVPAGAATATTPRVQTLYAGQHVIAGTVSVWNDSANLYIRYATSGGWELIETHLSVETSAAGIPQTKNGNPIPGHFANSALHEPPVTQYTCTIPISNDWRYPLTDLKIAAHAVVRMFGADRQILASEGAWASGIQFAGRNWATYFNYVRDLSAAEACTLIHDSSTLIILDVRPSGPYSVGHIAGAINVNYAAAPSPATFASLVSALDRSQTYLVYCGSGNTGGKAAALMTDLGFARVYNMAGGYAAWISAGGCPDQ
jgi:rhodanese-related sulfurtransferase